jgi:hypothetical protein
VIKQLSNEHYHAHLDPWLSRVLNRDENGLDWRRPFTEELPHRAILYPLAFAVPKPLFEELRRLSLDEPFVLSWLERFTDPEPIEMDWSITGDDFEEYRQVASDPVDQVLYSPSGDWAMVLTDEYGVVGSALSSVLSAVEEVAGPLADPREFIEEVRAAGAREGFAVSESWAKELLDHVLGRTRAAELVDEAS